MDPISSFVTGHVVGKLADKLGVTIIDAVKRGGNRRTANFAQAFCKQAASDAEPGQVDKLLDEILADETKRDALFDAYRRVALSASPTLGPRIIGLVMARVVGDGRQPTEEEEQVLRAAEFLSDSELQAARNDWVSGLAGSLQREEHVRHLGHGKTKAVQFLVLRGVPKGESGYEYWLLLGSWAGKLHSLGLSWTVDRIVKSPVDEKGYGTFETETAFETDMYYAAGYSMLIELVERAESIETAHGLSDSAKSHGESS